MVLVDVYRIIKRVVCDAKALHDRSTDKRSLFGFQRQAQQYLMPRCAGTTRVQANYQRPPRDVCQNRVLTSDWVLMHPSALRHHFPPSVLCSAGYCIRENRFWTLLLPVTPSSWLCSRPTRIWCCEPTGGPLVDPMTGFSPNLR